jgi:tripartite-type tricarboxylate transporter receptor subunit TctC
MDTHVAHEHHGRIKSRIVWAAALLAAAALETGHAAEQAYPSRPVRVIVGLAPGGGTDTVGRVLIQKLSETFGQSFVIDNRPSAGGNVAGELVAKATPDGHTLPSSRRRTWSTRVCTATSATMLSGTSPPSRSSFIRNTIFQ